MELITNVIVWFQANWATVGLAYSAIVTAASIIVKLTPTLKDDTALLAVIKWVAKYLALNVNSPEERP